MSLRITIIGYGRMGKEIDSLGKTRGYEIVNRLDIHNNALGEGLTAETLQGSDVAIDFSTAAATVNNLPKLAAAGINVVIGTTGWNDREQAMRQLVEDAGIGVVVAANFSLGVNLLLGIVERASSLFKDQDDFGAWIHESHHAAKVDSPSGTALALNKTMQTSGYTGPINLASTRAGSLPGTHTVGFDGPFETITLTHTARSRATFAQGALEAARWVKGRKGWFTMRDVLALD
jgi:4-hydroxy-tetrahydrodipicolinate reductase